MKILYGLVAFGLLAFVAYLLVSPATPEVVLNEPLPVALDNSQSEQPSTPPPVAPTIESSNVDQTATIQNVTAEIIGTPGHPAEGIVRVLSSDTSVVRFENYQGTNGPDLFVYLTNDVNDVSSGVNLGRSKSTSGSINYDVPNDVSVSDYRYVITWCERFGVLFDYAELRLTSN